MSTYTQKSAKYMLTYSNIYVTLYSQRENKAKPDARQEKPKTSPALAAALQDVNIVK
jgi:hypothetical protein